MNPSSQADIDRHIIIKLLVTTIEKRAAKVSDIQAKLALYQTHNKWVKYLLCTNLSLEEEAKRKQTVTQMINYRRNVHEKKKKCLIHLLQRASAHARIHIMDENTRKATVDLYERVLADLARVPLTIAEREIQARQVNETLLRMTGSEDLLDSSE